MLSLLRDRFGPTRADGTGRVGRGWLHWCLAGRTVAGVPESGKTWTADQIRALGVRTDLATACSIVYGIGRSAAWDRYHRGELCFPAIRSGRGVVVPVAPLLKLMMVEEEPPTQAPRRGKRKPEAA